MNPYFKRKTAKERKARKLRARRWWIIWRRWYRAEERSGESYECDSDYSDDGGDPDGCRTCGWSGSPSY